MRDLNGKVAWITGAGSGIGEAAVRALVSEGMRVVLSGRREEKLLEVAEAAGGNVRIAALDVSDCEAVSRTVEEIIEWFGRIDVLVNNAGINTRHRNWRDLSLQDWDKVMKVNLSGAFYCAKAVLPIMLEQQDGLIINVSSWAGKYLSAVTGTAYTASKAAMNAMSESLNMEAGHAGVRACVICPAEVATPILDERPVPVSEEARAHMLQPEDLGAIIRFIACQPEHVVINELVVSPATNSFYSPQVDALKKRGNTHD